jgi:hypothetical protein
VTRRPRIVDAPLAVTSGGGVLVNAAHLTRERGFDAAVEIARSSGRPVFVGVIATPGMTKTMLGDLDDACAEIVGRRGAKLARRAR